MRKKGGEKKREKFTLMSVSLRTSSIVKFDFQWCYFTLKCLAHSLDEEIFLHFQRDLLVSRWTSSQSNQFEYQHSTYSLHSIIWHETINCITWKQLDNVDWFYLHSHHVVDQYSWYWMNESTIVSCKMIAFIYRWFHSIYFNLLTRHKLHQETRACDMCFVVVVVVVFNTQVYLLLVLPTVTQLKFTCNHCVSL